MAQTSSQTSSGNGALVKKDDALVGAAVSAAIGVAVYQLRKALAEGRDEHTPQRPATLVPSW